MFAALAWLSAPKIGRPVLEQPGGVDDSLAQRTQESPEVVLAAIGQQGGAGIEIDAPVVCDHQHPLVELQARDCPAIRLRGYLSSTGEGVEARPRRFKREFLGRSRPASDRSMPRVTPRAVWGASGFSQEVQTGIHG